MIQPFGSFFEVHQLLDLTATISFIVLAVLGWRRLRMSYNIWIVLLLVYMLISTATGQHFVLESNQRFVLEMFPAFITLAALSVKHPRRWARSIGPYGCMDDFVYLHNCSMSSYG